MLPFNAIDDRLSGLCAALFWKYWIKTLFFQFFPNVSPLCTDDTSGSDSSPIKQTEFSKATGISGRGLPVAFGKNHAIFPIGLVGVLFPSAWERLQ